MIRFDHHYAATRVSHLIGLLPKSTDLPVDGILSTVCCGQKGSRFQFPSPRSLSLRLSFLPIFALRSVLTRDETYSKLTSLPVRLLLHESRQESHLSNVLKSKLLCPEKKLYDYREF